MVNTASAPRSVLYVEDNELNVLLMQALFGRRPDLRLQVAADCAAALRCARDQQPDLLLLDLCLPDGHGCALLPQLRALPGLQGVPAMAVTTEDLPAWNLHGFNGLWPRPMRMMQVLDQLDQWLPPGSHPPAPAPAVHAGRPMH